MAPPRHGSDDDAGADVDAAFAVFRGVVPSHGHDVAVCSGVCASWDVAVGEDVPRDVAGDGRLGADSIAVHRDVAVYRGASVCWDVAVHRDAVYGDAPVSWDVAVFRDVAVCWDVAVRGDVAVYRDALVC